MKKDLIIAKTMSKLQAENIDINLQDLMTGKPYITKVILDNDSSVILLRSFNDEIKKLKLKVRLLIKKLNFPLILKVMLFSEK